MKINMFSHLFMRFIQGVIWYQINLKNMFVKMKLIPILLPCIHTIIAQFWHRCAWFGNYLSVILSFFGTVFRFF